MFGTVPDTTFWIGEDLGGLADRLGGEPRRGDPLAARTIVVPNSLVGQWLEQSLASRVSGRFDGVAANLDVILPSVFIGRALYEDPADLERWGTDGFALAMLDARHDERELSVNEAWRRAQRLTDVLYWRPEQFGDYLEARGNEHERAVVRRLDEQGVPSPWVALEGGLDRVEELFGERLVLFDCGELTMGDLMARVVARVAERVSVDGYFVASGSDDLDRASLGARWSRGAIAHLERWRVNCPSARWTRVAVDHATAMRTEVVARLGAAPAPAAHDLRSTDLLAVHGAVGYARQVEIARDAILAAIREVGAAPHEVRVVTLDAERFVALMHEYWTRHGDPTAPTLQFEVADPTVAHASARLSGFATLLSTIASHDTIYDIVALLSEPAVHEGAGLTRRDVERVLELALTSGVSLGLDGPSREPVAAFAPGDDAGTWVRFSDRGVLASVFDAADSPQDLPIWPVGVPADLPVMAAISRLINALVGARVATRTSRTLSAWVRRFEGWTHLVVSPAGALDVGLDRALDRLRALARTSEGLFTFDEVRELFEQVATGVGGSSVLGRGGVTVQGPYALSHAPYRVTCVLGLDDELLPSLSSTGPHLGDARAGDPSPRDRFRAALLSLVATTSDRVILVTNDREVGDGSPLAPALVLAELTEALQVPGPDGVGLAVAWHSHPRYAFSTRAHDGTSAAADLADDATAAESFSLDPTAAALATLLVNKPAPSLEDDLAVTPSTMPHFTAPPVLELSRLIKFVKDPQKSFLETVFDGAAVADQRAELPDAPRLDIGDGLALWHVRHSIVRRALSTGAIVIPGHHPDDPIAAVATGLRDRVRRSVNETALTSFVEHYRGDLALVGAVRAPWSERPVSVAGLDVRVVRPAIEVYETSCGPVLVEWTVSKGFATAIANALVTSAVATVERGTAVVAVIVRPDYETEPPETNPFVTLTWRGNDAVGSATALLGALVTLYREQFETPPRHLYQTSLAGSGRDDLDAIYTKNASSVWEGRPGAPGGRRTAGAHQLLVPFTFDELTEVDGGAFRDASRRVRSLFDEVVVTSSTPGGPAWPVVLGGGRTS